MKIRLGELRGIVFSMLAETGRTHARFRDVVLHDMDAVDAMIASSGTLAPDQIARRIVNAVRGKFGRDPRWTAQFERELALFLESYIFAGR